jgi:predicted Zn-dependent protease
MSGAASQVEEARASYDAGDVARARELALAGLAERPDDPALLRLAGEASLELGEGDALGYLERAAALDPEDTGALVDLGHALIAAGRESDAAEQLRRAAERDPGNLEALRGLAELHRRQGRPDLALEPARRAADSNPNDPVALIDLADLCLEVGSLDDAIVAFARLRGVDDEPEHEIFAIHGMIEAELRRERWRRALDLAVDATRVDRLGRTTDVLAFTVAKVFGAGDRPAPEQADVEAALAATRAEHRRIHTEVLVA